MVTKIDGTTVFYNNGATQNTGKSYNGYRAINANETMPTSAWQKINVCWGASTTNVTLPALSGAQVGTKLYLQNCTSTTLGVTCAPGTTIFHNSTSVTYFELEPRGRIEIVKTETYACVVVYCQHRYWPQYYPNSRVTLSWNSWYEAPSSGVITITFTGSYRNDIALYTGSSTSSYACVAWMGDNWNTNTKRDSVAVPVAHRSWNIITSTGTWEGPEEVIAYFYPGQFI